jgi:flagellar hook-length control protein FliK
LNQGINSLFDTLSQREASAAQSADRFIQNELSFENVMQNISADAAQTQKNTIIQQAETISIMRKDFTDAVKDKVMVMINQKIQQIDIQLDPPELGSMQVRINMQNEQAVVNFVVQNQQAKDALEQNMDKLKHMMADNGVDVGGANVKQQSSQSSMQDQNNQGSQGEFANAEEGSAEQSISSEHAQEMKVSSTGVDYYA